MKLILFQTSFRYDESRNLQHVHLIIRYDLLIGKLLLIRQWRIFWKLSEKSCFRLDRNLLQLLRGLGKFSLIFARLKSSSLQTMVLVMFLLLQLPNSSAVSERNATVILKDPAVWKEALWFDGLSFKAGKRRLSADFSSYFGLWSYIHEFCSQKPCGATFAKIEKNIAVAEHPWRWVQILQAKQ